MITEHDTAHPSLIQNIENRVSDALDTFYEKIGKHHHGISGRVWDRFEPPADVAESNVGMRITMEIPGIDRNDIEILARDGTLTVSGEKRREHTEDKEAYHYRERIFGRFSRSIALGPDLEATQSKASFENGVLTIDVPLKPEAERVSRTIPVERTKED